MNASTAPPTKPHPLFAPIGIIAGREVRALLTTPLAWFCIAVVVFVAGYGFLSHLDRFIALEPQLRALPGAPGITRMVVAESYASAIPVLLLITPLLTMGSISAERQQGTLGLLLCAPVSALQIILGKFVGLMILMLMILAAIALMPLSLLLAGSLDWGLALCGLAGVGLVAGCFVAAGIYVSTLCAQPPVAAVITLGGLLMLWLPDAASSGDGLLTDILAYISLRAHFQPLRLGVLDSADLAWFVLFISTFLVLSIRRLDDERQLHQAGLGP